MISGFCRTVNEVVALLGHCAALRWLVVTEAAEQLIGPIFNGKAVQFFLNCLLDYFSLDDGTDKLSRNGGNKLPTNDAQCPKTAKVSLNTAIFHRI